MECRHTEQFRVAASSQSFASEHDAMDSCSILVVTDDRAFIADAVKIGVPRGGRIQLLPDLCLSMPDKGLRQEISWQTEVIRSRAAKLVVRNEQGRLQLHASVLP